MSRSRLDQLEPLLQAIQNDAKAAWGLSAFYLGQPRQEATRPYGYVAVSAIEMERDGAKTVAQSFAFEVVFRGTIAEGEVVLLTQIEKANTLIEKLMDAPQYQDLAYLPLVGKVDFGEDDLQSRDFEVVLEFSCIVEQWTHEAVV